MKCPHCRQGIHDSPQVVHLGSDLGGNWFIEKRECPECRKLIFRLVRGKLAPSSKVAGVQRLTAREYDSLIYPKGGARPPCPPEVSEESPEIAEDYNEACSVLADSLKASSALSRRCLQNLLREKAGVKQGNLADEIQQVLDSGNLPSHLSKAIDAVRNIGNFAAHPIKSRSSGEIVSVEFGEAEWNLDVLESLFDFYFVQPAITQRKRAAMDKKLADAGKPPMK